MCVHELFVIIGQGTGQLQACHCGEFAVSFREFLAGQTFRGLTYTMYKPV